MLIRVGNQLGFRLFDRTARQVVLTEYGNDLLAVTRRTLPELDVAISRIGPTAGGGIQSISVGTTPLIADVMVEEELHNSGFICRATNVSISARWSSNVNT